jgi:hypothetical protein
LNGTGLPPRKRRVEAKQHDLLPQRNTDVPVQGEARDRQRACHAVLEAIGTHPVAPPMHQPVREAGPMFRSVVMAASTGAYHFFCYPLSREVR